MTDLLLLPPAQTTKTGWLRMPFRSPQYKPVDDADCWDPDDDRLHDLNWKEPSASRAAGSSLAAGTAAAPPPSTVAPSTGRGRSRPRSAPQVERTPDMSFSSKPGCPLCGVVSSARDGSAHSPHKVLYRDDNFTAYQETANPVSSKGHIILAFKSVHFPSLQFALFS